MWGQPVWALTGFKICQNDLIFIHIKPVDLPRHANAVNTPVDWHFGECLAAEKRGKFGHLYNGLYTL